MIHRYNFTKAFRNELIKFGKENNNIHIDEFKLKWKNWKEVKKNIVKIEEDLLMALEEMETKQTNFEASLV